MPEADLIDQIVDLQIQIDEAVAALNLLKERRNALDGEGIEYFIETGTQRVTRRGKTVYLSTTWRSSIPASVDKEEAYEALRKHGLGHAVKEQYNASTLSADIRERIAERGEELAGMDGDEVVARILPPALSFIRLYNDIKIKVVKAS